MTKRTRNLHPMHADVLGRNAETLCISCDAYDRDDGSGPATRAVVDLTVGELWSSDYARLSLCRECIDRMARLCAEAAAKVDRRAAEMAAKALERRGLKARAR